MKDKKQQTNTQNLDKQIKKTVKSALDKRLKKFSNNTVPKIIDGKPKQKFLEKMFATIPYTQTTNLMDISRMLATNEDDVHTCECYLSRNINDGITPFELASLLCKDALTHLTNNNFYLIIDQTTIEKPFGDLSNKNGCSMENLSWVFDNAKKQLVLGYEMVTIIAVKRDNKSPFVLGSSVFSSTSNDYVSELNELKKLLNVIFNEFRKQNKHPYVIICDSGYDNQKVFQYFTDNNYNWLVRYANKRHFLLKSKDGNYLENKSYTAEELYEKSTNVCKIEYHTKQGKPRTCIAKYEKCYIKGNYKTPVYLVMYFDKVTNNLITLITTIPIRNCKEAQRCVYRYTSRWVIEELFRFMKKIFHIENFLVRKLKTINNLLLIVLIVVNFMNKIHDRKSKFKKYLLKTAKTKTKSKLNLYKFAIAFQNLIKDTSFALNL